MTDEVSQALGRQLVDAYEEFVIARTQSYGVDLGGAIGAGKSWLQVELERELAAPYPEQRRGPLEIFQAAMSFPTEALATAGEAKPTRDPMAVHALPGDVFDLAPASSRDIGEAVWSAHLVWGVTKAAVLKGLAGPEGS